MATHTLVDPFEQHGEWWLPEAPARRIAGHIAIRGDRHAELNLLDSFQPIEGVFRIGDHKEYPVIWGTSADGDAVTLLDCHQVRRSFKRGTGGLRTPECLQPAWTLIGMHAGPGAPCSKVLFRVPGLPIWLAQRLITGNVSDADSALPGTSRSREMTYRVRCADQLAVRSDAMPGRISMATNVGSRQDSFTTLAVGVSGWISIEADGAQPLSWYLEQFHRLSGLLAMLAGTPMAPDCISARAGDQHEEISVLVALQSTKPCTFRSPADFFLPYPLIETDIGTLLNRWYALYPKWGLPCQLALSAAHTDGPWNHVRFVSAIQALEGLHRSWFSGTYLSEDEYKPVKKALAGRCKTRRHGRCDDVIHQIKPVPKFWRSLFRGSGAGGHALHLVVTQCRSAPVAPF